MSGIFHRFQALPWELQLMVFEEFILATKKPRIVLLDVEEVQIVTPDILDFDGWQFRVGNREELHAENPRVVARSLLGVCSASRHAATQFLDRPDEIIKPPRYDTALMGLGLSLSSDVFWIPDDLLQFMKTCDNIPASYLPPEEEDIDTVMLSLHTLEQVFHRCNARIREDHSDLGQGAVYHHALLHELFFAFSGMRNLVIMVDVPRGHVSWDQLQVVGVNDPTSVTMSVEDGPARCHSALENYLALQSDYMKVVAHERRVNHEMMDSEDETTDFEDDGWFQQWPDISFAFMKPLLSPRSASLDTLY